MDFLKKNLSITVVLFIFGLNMYSQGDLSKHNIQAPTTRDFGLYGDTPVDLYTGRANISIPLYYESGDNFNLNIELNYDTRGFLMNTLPGNTGHGWSLNPGGAIMRKRNGNCDEDYVTDYQHGQISHRLTNYISNTYTKDAERLGLKTIAKFQTGVIDGKVYDFCPDEFFFNFCGMSGSFFLDNDKNWRVRSENNLRVAFDIDDQSNYIYPFTEVFYNTSNKMPQTIKGFTIIDDNGTQYIFGGTTNAIEYSMPMEEMGTYNCRAYWRADSWHLTKIIDVHGKTLCSFKYERDKFAVQITNNRMAEFVYECKKTEGYLGKITKNLLLDENYFKYMASYDNNYKFPYYISFNAPVYLSSIQTRSGTSVIFKKSTDPKDRIKPSTDFYANFKNEYEKRYINNSYSPKMGLLVAWGKNNNINKDYPEFPYLQVVEEEYKNCLSVDAHNLELEDNPLDAIDFFPLKEILILREGKFDKRVVLDFAKNPRLHLTGVSVYGIRDNRMKCFQQYHLNYYDYDKLDNDYVTKNTDYWGYCNGDNKKNQNASKYKMPNSYFGQRGMLKEIVYPTGGRTVIEYEQNTYSSHLTYDRSELLQDSINIETGGLRIKRLTDYDKDSTLSRDRTYCYNKKDSPLSSGQAISVPIDEYVYSLFSGKGTREAIMYTTVRSDNSVIPLSNSHGVNVGYSLVTEIRNDGTRHESQFTNFEDYHDELSERGGLLEKDETQKGEILPFDNFTSLGFARGKITKSICYDAKGTIVSEDTFEYGFLNPSNSPCSSAEDLSELLSKGYTYIPTCFVKQAIYKNYYHIGSRYKIYYKPFVLLQKYSKVKNENGFYATKTSYKYKYSQDSFAYGLNAKEYKGNAVRCIEQITESCSKGSNSIMKTITSYPSKGMENYQIFNRSHFYNILETSTSIDGQLYKKDTYKYMPTVSIDGKVMHTTLPFFVGKSVYYKSKPLETIEINQYTGGGQIGQYTANGTMMTLLWDNYGKLCAKYSNGSSLPIVFKPNTSIEQTLTVNGKSVYNSKLPIEAFVYKYDDHGLLKSITSPSLNTEYYEYDFAGRLLSVKNEENRILNAFKYNSISDQDYEYFNETVQIPEFPSDNLIEDANNSGNSIKLVAYDYKGNARIEYSIDKTALEAHIEYFLYEDERNVYKLNLQKGKYKGQLDLDLTNLPSGSYEIWLCVDGVRIKRELIYKNPYGSTI